MKKYLFLFSMTAITGASAQSNKVVNGTGYIKNDQLFYQVSGCVPSSTVEVYSDPSGGKIVATATANERGVALVEIPKGAPHAFALNSNFANARGVKGNAYITVLKEPVLTARSFTVTDNGKPSLQWEVISKSADVRCDIFRNDDMAGYKKIGSLSRNVNPGNLFIFSDALVEGSNASSIEYDIKITDAVNNLQFTLGSQKIEKEFSNTAKVFPSVFSDEITISVPGGAGDLKVYNNTGNLVYSNKLKEGSNKVNLAKLAAATYFIKVTDVNNKLLYKGRVIKSN